MEQGILGSLVKTNYMPDLEHAHHHAIDKLIILSSFVSGISLLPEIYRVVSTHIVSSMSAVTLWIILLNSIVWLVYGMHCTLRSLLISSGLSILTAGFLLLAPFLY